MQERRPRPGGGGGEHGAHSLRDVATPWRHRDATPQWERAPIRRGAAPTGGSSGEEPAAVLPMRLGAGNYYTTNVLRFPGGTLGLSVVLADR